MLRTRFLGTGFAVPDRVVTNDDLSKIMDTSDEWIRTRTGIQERRHVREGETGVDLALAATKRALEMADLAAGSIDAIVYATSTPDHFAPGTASSSSGRSASAPSPRSISGPSAAGSSMPSRWPTAGSAPASIAGCWWSARKYNRPGC